MPFSERPLVSWVARQYVSSPGHSDCVLFNAVTLFLQRAVTVSNSPSRQSGGNIICTFKTHGCTTLTLLPFLNWGSSDSPEPRFFPPVLIIIRNLYISSLYWLTRPWLLISMFSCSFKLTLFSLSLTQGSQFDRARAKFLSAVCARASHEDSAPEDDALIQPLDIACEFLEEPEKTFALGGSSTQQIA